MTTESETELSAAARRLILINVCLAQFMGAVDARSLNVALPTLSTEFGATMAVIQWVPIAYQLTLIGLVLSLGRLGDVAGRKKIYNLGFMIFFAGSALCGFATGVVPMVLFQILEGIGGAMILANGRAIVTAVFPGGSRGRALGITSTAFHMGYIVGPSLAGFLIDSLGWRWIFFVNLPVILAGAIMSSKVIPDTVKAKRGYSVDFPGAVTLLAAVSALVLGLNREAHFGFDRSTGALLLLAAALLALFIFIERRADEPLLDLGLFKERSFAAGIMALALVSLAQTSTFFLLPFYLQGLLGLTPTEMGVTLIFYSVVIVFLAPVGGSLSDRFGPWLLCIAGCFGTFVGVLAMARFGLESGRVGVIVPLMIMGLGWSLFASPNLSALFSSVTPDRFGAVGGMTVTTATIANAIGVSLGSMLFARWLEWGGAPAAVDYKEWSRAPAAYLAAFQHSWLIIAGFALLALVISAIGKKPPRAKTGAQEKTAD